ncbi:MAG: undecaprenyl-diphosphate phosphatase [Candidatus Eisenbacteria bacterium]|nr:undecaprenyl-diphosphate phosphatase [Candidatus Eisenbacteria bacterium]
MSWQSAVILGMVQGLTELLPVSSSGHLVLAETLLGLRLTDLSFEIAVHVATAAAVCFYLRAELVSMLRALVPWGAASSSEQGVRDRGRTLLIAVVVGTLPAVVVGLVAYDAVERVFHSVGLTVAALPLTGVFLLSTKLARDRRLGVSPVLALVVGLAQAVAIIPGISRSGMTVGAALLLGMKKDDAVKFSFLLSLPAILGGAVLKLAKDAGESAAAASSAGAVDLASPTPAAASHLSTTALLVGSAVAFVFALIAARTLLGVVRRGKLEYFGYYCILAGVAFLVFT